MSKKYEKDGKLYSSVRSVGFARYKEVLEDNWKTFFIVGFISIVFYIPFAAGMVYAYLSKSALVALLSGIIGGAIAGPGMAAMYDNVLRRLRNDFSDWWTCWKKAIKQNWHAAILPGVIQLTFVSMVLFSVMLMYWGASRPSLGTIAILAVGSLFMTMVMTVWWAQSVLFSQKSVIMIKNSLLFCLFHFWRALAAAAIQVGYWFIMMLLMPWTAYFLPILNVWYIRFVSLLIIYRPLNQDLKIEEQIRTAFPGSLGDEEYIP